MFCCFSYRCMYCMNRHILFFPSLGEESPFSVCVLNFGSFLHAQAFSGGCGQQMAFNYGKWVHANASKHVCCDL